MAGLRLKVTCPCGRALRARLDQAGTEIVCWDCRATVRVPIPAAPSGWVVRLMGIGAKQIFDARTCTFLVVGAAIVTIGAAVPTYGIAGAAVALALIMTGYGELLRRGTRGDWSGRPDLDLAARLWRGLLCLGTAGALVLPLVAASRSGAAPRVTPIGLAIGAGLVAALPLLMLATYGLAGSPGTRAREIAAMVRRHPFAVLATLLMLPASLLAIETAVVVVLRVGGAFEFLALDLLPNPASVRHVFGTPYIGDVDYRMVVDGSIWSIYFDTIRHGYSLVGAIPASVVLDDVSNHFAPISVALSSGRYQTVRIVFTLLIAAGMLSVLAIQARWLGLLATMDVRRTTA